MRILILVALFLVGCSSAPTYQAEPQKVVLHVLSSEEWFQRVPYPMIYTAFANTGGEVCRIYVPAHDIPSKEIWAHELHHCEVGPFHPE